MNAKQTVSTVGATIVVIVGVLLLSGLAKVAPNDAGNQNLYSGIESLAVLENSPDSLILPAIIIIGFFALVIGLLYVWLDHSKSGTGA